MSHDSVPFEVCTSNWDAVGITDMTPVSESDYLYKTDAMTPRRTVVRFSTPHFVINSLLAKSERHVGYAVRVLPNGHAVQYQAHHMMLLDPNAKFHKNPKYIGDIPGVHVVRFDTGTDLGYAYWITARRKSTCL